MLSAPVLRHFAYSPGLNLLAFSSGFDMVSIYQYMPQRFCHSHELGGHPMSSCTGLLAFSDCGRKDPGLLFVIDCTKKQCTHGAVGTWA